MKKFSNLIVVCLVLFSAIYLSACNGGSEPSPSELAKQIAALKGTWTGTATIQNEVIQNVTVTFNEDKTFTASGVEAKDTDLPAQGTWNIEESDLMKVKVANNISFTINQLTASKLNFTISAPEDKGVARTITYDLTKQ